MRGINAFSGKTFGTAMPQQKVRERRRRTIKAAVRRVLAPFIAVARPVAGFAKRSGLAFRQAAQILWRAVARFAAMCSRAGGVFWRSIRPIRRFFTGVVRQAGSAAWRLLRPIILGIVLAPGRAASEARQFVAAIQAVRMEIARLRKLGAENARRLVIATREDVAAASESLGKRALANFLAVRRRALGLAERTRLFLNETSAAIRQGGHVLLRTLRTSGQAGAQGLMTGAVNLARSFPEFWTAPIKLLRRFAGWLPVAAATLGQIAGRAGVTAKRFLGNTLRAVASVLLIAGFTILFVITVVGRGTWSLVQASAMASVWLAIIAVKIAWWTIRGLGLATAYGLMLLARLAGAILRSGLRSLAAGYAAMPRVLQFVLRPIVAALAAIRDFLLVSARTLAAASRRLGKAFYRRWLALTLVLEHLWVRITAIRLPRFRLRPRGEEALAYTAVVGLSIALLMYTGLVEPGPLPPPAPAPAARATLAETRAPPPVESELEAQEITPTEALTPEIKEPPAAEPKMAYAKPPVVAPPVIETPDPGAAPRQRPAPRAVPPGTAKIAIVIDDMGMKRGMTGPFAELPGRLTFAFLPYAGDLRRQTRRVREAGHELFVHLPMEPKSRIEDPGPNALLTRLSAEELVGRIKWNLNRFDGFVGINNHMGSLFTQSRAHMRPVLEAMRSRHLVYLDSKTTATDVGPELAEELGVPWIRRDIFLDNIRTRVAIDEQLARTVRVAQQRGQAVAIGHNYQVTLDALRDWLPAVQSAGFQLVTVSELIYGKKANAEARRAEAAGAGQ